MEKVVVITGPTATGKTDLAIEIAKQCNGEIINADVMQVYQGLDIATNKPTVEERKGIAHHLLASVPLHDTEKCGGGGQVSYTVHDYQREARALISEINARQKLPILVGGTNYYIQAVIVRDFLAPMVDEGVPFSDWAELDDMKQDGGDVQLYEKLRKLDPQAAAKLHPNDVRKIKRALQVHQMKQKKSNHSELRTESRSADHARHELMYQCVFIQLECKRNVLNERINQRVLQMVKRGLLEEVKQFRERAISNQYHADYTQGIFQTIGYKEFVPYLEALECRQSTAGDEGGGNGSELDTVVESCVTSLQAATRRYARRQESWFRNKWAAPGSPLFGDSGSSCLYCMDVTESLSDPDRHRDLIRDAVSIVHSFSGGTDIEQRLLDKYLVRPPEAMQVDSVPEAQLWKKYRCEKCERELNGWREWQAHLASRMHKKKKKRKRQLGQETSQGFGNFSKRYNTTNESPLGQ